MANLNSVTAKLERAKKHLEEARSISFRTITNSDFSEAFGEYHSKDRRLYIKLRSIGSLPPSYGIVVGDAAHNIRSAIDHIAFAFAKAPTKGAKQGVQFPLVSQRGKSRSCSARFNELAKTMLPGASNEVVAAIKRFQPYRSRQHRCLAQLNSINNWDKHRSLAITSVNTPNSRFGLPAAVGKLVVGHKILTNRILKKGAILAWFELSQHPDPEVQVKPELLAGPVFNRRMTKGLPGVPVLQPLWESIWLLEGKMLPVFERL